MFVMYCVYGESGSSQLITDSMIYCMYNVMLNLMLKLIHAEFVVLLIQYFNTDITNI